MTRFPRFGLVLSIVHFVSLLYFGCCTISERVFSVACYETQVRITKYNATPRCGVGVLCRRAAANSDEVEIARKSNLSRTDADLFLALE